MIGPRPLGGTGAPRPLDPLDSVHGIQLQLYTAKSQH